MSSFYDLTAKTLDGTEVKIKLYITYEPSNLSKVVDTYLGFN